MHNRALCGVVIEGAKRGKQLGFPTANLEISPHDLPDSGIYAAWARLAGEKRWRRAAASVGVNPTFDGSLKKLEVHLLDFSADLYGRSLEVQLVRFLRPERRFETREALIRQIAEDCRQARKILANISPLEEP